MNILHLSVYFSFLIIVIHSKTQLDNSKIICTQGFCETYEVKNGCPDVPRECKIQNTTHNGLYLPHAAPCNCCKYCLKNLNFNETCIVGSPDGPLPDVICGDGLYCNSETSKCEPNPSECMMKQKDYDNRKNKGEIGHMELRPKCDRRGNFVPVQCIPGEICFCMDIYGNRIFGEMPYSQQALDITKCGCSRIIDKHTKIINDDSYSPLRAKCSPNGNFDKLQCVNKNCTCVDEFDGSPVDPSKRSGNINLITEMACYNESIHFGFFRPCEKKYNEILEEIAMLKKDGYEFITGAQFPSCQLDGRYAAIQENETHNYCASPDGKMLEDYVVEKNTQLAEKMNCNCARARIIIPGFEKPACCANGNYKTMQCRRGKCRCVTTNGVQIEVEKTYSNRKKLGCSPNECTS